MFTEYEANVTLWSERRHINCYREQNVTLIRVGTLVASVRPDIQKKMYIYPLNPNVN